MKNQNFSFDVKSIKKVLLTLLIWVCLSLNTMGQTIEEKVIVLDKSAFTISLINSSDSLLELKVVNTLISEVSPFFIEVFFNGILYNEKEVKQNINNMEVTNNMEFITGPMFLGLGLNEFPALGNYKIKLQIKSKTDKNTAIKIRIYGVLNGNKVNYFSTYNL